MSYTSKKTGKNEITVMKKDTGEVVGHATPEKYDAYMAALHMHEPTRSGQGMAEGGEVTTMEPPDEKDPGVLPEDIKELIKMVHKDQIESRPDENWRIKPADKDEPVAPYKKDEDAPPAEAERAPGYASGGVVKGYDDGGPVQPTDFTVDGGDSDTTKMNGLMPTLPAPPAPAAPAMAPPSPIDVTNIPPPAAPLAPGDAEKAMAGAGGVPRGTMPAPTDQDFMDRANKMLGLNPQDQAAFLRLLGDKSQKGQIGAGIAGIGDAIASGGTLGKVNPGNMNRAEDIIQNKEKAGMEGMQTIRGNQEKATELGLKLQANDPNSPLSKYAQKAYGSLGKKLGIDLSHASASLISDITGKGVAALNDEAELALKQASLGLQKEQIEATIGNQKAERANAEAGRKAEAAKALAGRGILSTVANAIPGTTGHAATEVLKEQATGKTEVGPYGAETVRGGKTYEWSPSTQKYHLKQ
jgi:hypothetical protein